MKLLETVFALGLLALLLLAVLRLLPGAALSVRHTELQGQAQSLAEETLESARSSGFSALLLGSATLPVVPVGPVNYTIQREVFAAGGMDPKYLKGLRATVSWDFRGVHHQVMRESWISVVKN